MRSLTRTCRILFGGALAASLAVLPMAGRAADADLEIALVKPPTDFHYGETLTYEAQITNLGPSVATGVEITAFDVAAPLVLKSVGGCTPTPAAVTAGTLVPCIVDDGQVIDEPDPAHPAFQKTVTFDVKLPVPLAGDPAVPTLPTVCPDGTGLAAVTVTVGLAATIGDPAVPNPTVDPNPANNSVTSPVPKIGTFTDLGITMTAPASASIGDTIDVSATVINNGPCVAPNVLADDEQGLTTLTLEFVSADGDCDQDPLNGTCSWPSLAVGETKTWTIHYKVLEFPKTLMQSGEPVSITVFRDPKAAADPIDTDSSNDSAVTQTIVKKSVGSCSTGGMGGALGLLVLAVPFLRRRRKS